MTVPENVFLGVSTLQFDNHLILASVILFRHRRRKVKSDFFFNFAPLSTCMIMTKMAAKPIYDSPESSKPRGLIFAREVYQIAKSMVLR